MSVSLIEETFAVSRLCTRISEVKGQLKYDDVSYNLCHMYINNRVTTIIPLNSIHFSLLFTDIVI